MKTNLLPGVGGAGFPTFPVPEQPIKVGDYLCQAAFVRAHFSIDDHAIGRSLDVHFSGRASGGGDGLAFVRVTLPAWSGGPETMNGPLINVPATTVNCAFSHGMKAEDCARALYEKLDAAARGYTIKLAGTTVMISEQMHPL
jgi:hypothetical protein